MAKRYRDSTEIPGLFITFEGCEGSGKTTQAELLNQYLASRGQTVVVAREPGGTTIGARIRDIILDPAVENISPITEALLFAADRVQQLDEVIVPALKKGWTVIADRYLDSSLAYQGLGRKVGLQAIGSLNRWATGGLEPDLTFVLDIPVNDARKRKSGDRPDRMEREPFEFHQSVRDAYRTLAEMYPRRMVVLDARPGEEEIHRRVVEEVQKILRTTE